MKIISLIIIGLACAMTGQYVAFRLTKHVRTLEKISLMLGTVENEISYLGRPTCELIKILSEKDELKELDFLQKCLSLSKSGDDIVDAWASSISQSNVVNGEDACILYSFGEGLGRSDIDGQISSCKYHEKLVNEKLNEAREKRKRYASLACGLGMLSGIGVFIVLF